MAMVKGSVDNPTAADILAVSKLPRWKVLGIAAPQSASDIAFVFSFPAVWICKSGWIPTRSVRSPSTIPASRPALTQKTKTK